MALSAGIDHAQELGLRVAIAIVGDDGNPLGTVRHPAAFLTAPAVAVAKAFTARNFGRSTAELAEQIPVDTRRDLAGVDRRLCFVRGGVPAAADGADRFAVGVSGATAEQDERIAIRVRDVLAAGAAG